MLSEITRDIFLGMLLGVIFIFIVVLAHSNFMEEPPLQTLMEGGFLLMLAVGNITAAVFSTHKMLLVWFYKGTKINSRNSTIAAFCSPALISILILIATGDQTQTPYRELVLFLAGITLLIGLSLIQVQGKGRR